MLSFHFSELGGYDCMTDAFFIKEGWLTIAVIDLNSFGQKACTAPPPGAKEKAEKFAKLFAAAPEMLSFIESVAGTHSAVGREALALLEKIR